MGVVAVGSALVVADADGGVRPVGGDPGSMCDVHTQRLQQHARHECEHEP
jgi:hypothetical protein